MYNNLNSKAIELYSESCINDIKTNVFPVYLSLKCSVANTKHTGFTNLHSKVQF